MLEGVQYIMADSAYTLTKHVVSPFGRTQSRSHLE
ncbi:TPA: hypothetical protein N0F65_004416, partial [Lagenidium giganteum]